LIHSGIIERTKSRGNAEQEKTADRRRGEYMYGANRDEWGRWKRRDNNDEDDDDGNDGGEGTLVPVASSPRRHVKL
jgi:hypothetical protein